MKQLSMLFKKKPEDDLRSVSKLMRWTNREWEQIAESARIRSLTPTEFIRRAALGRKADVRYEAQIILELRAVVAAIKACHKEYVVKGLKPPTAEFGILIEEAIAAIKRITK